MHQFLFCPHAVQGRARADGIQSLVALATPEFAATLVQRGPDGSLPPQTPELLAKMVPPMFGALQRVLAPLLPDGKLREPGFVQVCCYVLYALMCVCMCVWHCVAGCLAGFCITPSACSNKQYAF
jgi:hypothetical protein